MFKRRGVQEQSDLDTNGKCHGKIQDVRQDQSQPDPVD